MWKTPSRERVCEVQPLEGNSSSQRYTQQQRRFSDFGAISNSISSCSLSGTNQASTSRRRASEFPRSLTGASPGIVCSNTDLISILSSLTSSATEINRCGEERESSKSLEQKRRRLKDHRSNSFDVSILHGTGSKQSSVEKASTEPPPSSWFANRHQPMWKKQKSVDVPSFSSSSSSSAIKLGVIKTVKETLAKSSPPKETRHKVVWDDSSGTRVDAQVLGSAIEEFLTSQSSKSESSSGKPAVSPGKPKPGKVASWFSGGNKEPEAEACEPSICSSLKDLFVK